MQQYNVFQAIYMSFYSRRLYRDVALNWGGKAFLYLFMLLALSFISFTYRTQLTLNLFYHESVTEIVKQLPILTVKEGKISTPENHPYTIMDSKTNKKVAVIDTTGQYKTLEEAGAPVLLTETTLISQTSPDQIRIDQVPSQLTAILDPNVINNYIAHYLNYLWIGIYIFGLLGMYVYRIIQSLLYAILGKLFSAMNQINLSYGQIVQIVMVALTPCIVLNTLSNIFMLQIPFALLLYFILTIFYMVYGILANRSKV